MSCRLLILFVLLMAVILVPVAHAEETSGESLRFSATEVTLERDGLTIYGELLLPDTAGPLPLVILSHGFGGNHSQMSAYAEAFARHGIAVAAPPPDCAQRVSDRIPAEPLSNVAHLIFLDSGRSRNPFPSPKGSVAEKRVSYTNSKHRKTGPVSGVWNLTLLTQPAINVLAQKRTQVYERQTLSSQTVFQGCSPSGQNQAQHLQVHHSKCTSRISRK